MFFVFQRPEPHWSVRQTVAPLVEPLSLADAKAHLRVDVSDDDSLITTLVTSARLAVERIISRSLITQTWQLNIDRFPDSNQHILLPQSPAQSVSQIQYVDQDGLTQTFASSKYTLDSNDQRRPRIALAFNESWPSEQDVVNAVTITYVAGFGSASSDVPEDLTSAIKLLVGLLYENREQITVTNMQNIPFGVMSLLADFRVYWAEIFTHDNRGTIR